MTGARRILLAAAVLAAAPAAEAAVSFAGDWESGVNGGWLWTQETAPDRIAVEPGVRSHGRAAARVTVMPGDNPTHLPGEHAQVLMMTSRAAKRITEGVGSGTQYFAVSYQIPSSWSVPPDRHSGTWSVALQLHGPDEYRAPPAIALSVTDRWSVTVWGGDVDGPGRPVSVDLSRPHIARDKFADFVFMVRFAAGNDGAVAVWRRDEGEAAFTRVLSLESVPTLQSKQGESGPHYWKAGLSRNAVGRVDKLWLGPMARATSFEEAERAAFGTEAGRKAP